MPDPTEAEATKPYLVYLDKEMTIQGILSTFCVAASAAALDRVLAAEHNTTSDFIKNLQTSAFPYFISAIIALLGAGFLFYSQRSMLAWLHGQISLAVTREMRHIPIPSESYCVKEGLDVGDSWTFWNRYKWGLILLVVSALECALALVTAESGSRVASWLVCHWLVSLVPFLFGFSGALWLWYALREKESLASLKRKKPASDLRKARNANSRPK